MMLDAVRASGGRAVAVERGAAARVDGAGARERRDLASARKRPSASAPGAAAPPKAGSSADEEVVVFNTGAAQKYPEAMACDLPRLDKDAAVDWERVAAGV